MTSNATDFDVIIIGGGPAGLAAALAVNEGGGKVLIIEREERLGGILKQCIHDGFGLVTFKERISGPEYSQRYIKRVLESDIEVNTLTFVTDVKKDYDNYLITLVNSKRGIFKVSSKAIILATGCRERTARQVFINGDRPAGIYTAGTAQYFTNIQGYLPCKKCIILGSGDIGLIMARRLTLEGAKVLGVYEVKSTPSGLSRNIAQCLNDYNIPLHLSHTVTRVIGDKRIKAVEVCKVDENMRPIKETKELIECDGLILSVGLMPENEVAEKLGVNIDKNTKGPIVNQSFMTNVKGVFSCGNALHVNDLVDYVSESGKLAGESAINYIKNKTIEKCLEINYNRRDFLYIVPQKINIFNKEPIILYFRSSDVKRDVTINLEVDDNIILRKNIKIIKPPEMERLIIHPEKLNLDSTSIIKLYITNTER